MKTTNGATDKAIHLQGIGSVKAKAAGEIVEGDVLVWNYGITSKVTAVRAASKAYVVASMMCADGIVRERRMMKTRLVAFA